MIDDTLANLYDAGAVRVPGWLALVTALASVRPDDVGASIDWLVANREALERAYAAGRTEKLAAAIVPPEMQYEPELGFLDRAANDHQVRGRSLFGDLAAKSFMQLTVFAIAGIEISAGDAALLDELAAINLTLDRRAWPMAVTRRVGARTRDYAAATVAGLAMMGTHVLAGAAAADCARFLVCVHGREVRAEVDRVLARRMRVMGFGRPVVGPDERVPRMQAALTRHGREALPYVSTMRDVEAAFVSAKGLHATSAGWVAAILLDYGLTPDHIHAIANAWVALNVWAQAAYSVERGGPM